MLQGSKTGKDNGYTMLFDIESFDYSYYSEGSEGLKLALVHHLDMPIMRQKGFHIAPGTENQIALTPTLLTTSENAMSRYEKKPTTATQKSQLDQKNAKPVCLRQVESRGTGLLWGKRGFAEIFTTKPWIQVKQVMIVEAQGPVLHHRQVIFTRCSEKETALQGGEQDMIPKAQQRFALWSSTAPHVPI